MSCIDNKHNIETSYEYAIIAQPLKGEAKKGWFVIDKCANCEYKRTRDFVTEKPESVK